MTVKELIEELQSLDPNALVVMAKDPEGNGYSPLYEIGDEETYFAETTWSGRCIPNDRVYGEVQADEGNYDEGVAAICLVPVN